MCGIAGVVSLDGRAVDGLANKLAVMNSLIEHRGPDGHGVWMDPSGCAGFAHRRLAIVDLSENGAQPMVSPAGRVLVHNGEIYNFVELRAALESAYAFRGHSDTETILAAHQKWGDAAIDKFRGMWAFALWDPAKRRLLASRDWFGIKPFYYTTTRGVLYFASEIKALLPFAASIETDEDALAAYVSFQLPLGEETLFKGIHQLAPASTLVIENGAMKIQTIWKPDYTHDVGRTPQATRERLEALVSDSLRLHLRSDVPVGAYLSGGVDSSLIAALSRREAAGSGVYFHGKFTEYPGYDESTYAHAAAQLADGVLHEVSITGQDFVDTIDKVIYHLDHPVAGPGSFPQYMVSGLCAQHVKVVLGGQGGDEIFGGYQRYLIGYLEQALLEAIEGRRGLDISLADLAPNLSSLNEYKPLIRQAFSRGLFDPLSQRYLRLVDRAADLRDEIDLDALPMAGAVDRFLQDFDRPGASDAAPFDKMMRWDFTRLLPALLQVEDRMGMAHGLESRVPLLDRPLVEYLAATPSAIKMPGGAMKHLLRDTFADALPPQILARRDKMGFPVPLKEWFSGPLREYIHDIFESRAARERPYAKSQKIIANLDSIGQHSRKLWGLLSLELWQRQFIDRAGAFSK